MAANEAPVLLTAHCLCKAHIFTCPASPSQLPLPASSCHCSSCRHVTGALYTTAVAWPQPRSSIPAKSLHAYRFSDAFNLLSCSTCSTPFFWDDVRKSDDELNLKLFTGTLSNVPFEVVRFEQQIYVGDTGDGGASVWLRRVNGDGSLARRYQARPEGEADEGLPGDWPGESAYGGYESEGENEVAIQCRCKGVDLVWRRGDYSDTAKDELPFFIDPKTHKARGGFCGCNSCRLSGGVDVCNWTFCELKHIASAKTDLQNAFPINTAALKAAVDTRNPSIGTLTYFASSPDVQRYFCRECAACVFYACDDRPDMVDIAIGLLDAPDGARAESLLSWDYGGEISKAEDNDGGWRGDLLQRVSSECEEWRISRGYPKSWRRIAREEAATVPGK